MLGHLERERSGPSALEAGQEKMGQMLPSCPSCKSRKADPPPGRSGRALVGFPGKSASACPGPSPSLGVSKGQGRV